MTIAIFLKVQEFGLSYMLPTSLAGACWYLLPPVLLVHDFQHSIGRQPPYGVGAPPVCCLPLFCLQIICLSILVCGHLSHFYHPFMDSVFFFPWEISLYIHLRFCLFLPLWSLLKGLWAYAFAFGGGSCFCYPRSDPRPYVGLGVR